MFTRHKYIDSSKVDWTTIENPAASIKRDGAHFFLSFDSKGAPSFISRRPSVKGGFPDKTNRVPHLASFKAQELAGHTYSVELVHTGKVKTEDDNHARVSGILNSLPAKAIESQKEHGPVRAVLLDTINPPLQTYAQKMEHLNKVERIIGKSDLIFSPKVYTDLPSIVKLIDHTKNTGKEGVIVTSWTKPELHNPRVKIKHIDTYNLRVVGMEEEHDIHGKPKGSMGALILADATGKIVGKMGTGFTRDMRIDMWTHKSRVMNSLIQGKTFGQGGVDRSGKLRVLVYNGAADGECDTIS